MREHNVALRVSVVGLALLMALTPLVGASPRDRFRPLVGGIQIQVYRDESLYATCSISYPAYTTVYENGEWVTEWGIVTASHCTDLGDQIYQPTGTNPENWVGTTSIDLPYPRDSDAAFILTMPWDPSSEIYLDDIHRTYIYGVISEDEMQTDMHVWRIGRTTGLAEGKFKWKGYSIYLYPGVYLNRYMAMDFPIVVEGGDSGGTIFVWDNSTVNSVSFVVGLTVGKKGFFFEDRYKIFTIGTHVDWVADELGVYVLTVYGPSPPSPPGVTGG